MKKNFLILIGLSITDVEFPSVVICSQGINIKAIVAAMFFYIFDRLNTTTDKQFNLTTFQSADLIIRKFSGVCIKLLPPTRKKYTLSLKINNFLPKQANFTK